MKKLISVILVLVIGFGCGYAVKATASKTNTYMDECVYYANNPEHPQTGRITLWLRNMGYKQSHIRKWKKLYG